ncbi:HAD superfamily hydrolase [Spiroplasma helicoides]|uniref:HAD superfamily hydrolase n=1 Tax=Spiroplasma helicoides TaxID=216938 RepID=A0A1B3SKZ8_9MOLU|nr:HAD family hydrolase [Spiroplasma helicoides]AOG60611.1 HAD superfamily hydrolase [Spiroplasma helicoides]
MGLPYVGCDLDGTIVKNSDFTMLDKTVEDINFYQEKSNNKFFIVTGRLYETSKLYIHKLNVKLPVVLSNGATIIDPTTKEVLYENQLPINTCETILDYAIENNIELIFYSATEFVSLKGAERAIYFENTYAHLEKQFRPVIKYFDNLQDLRKYAINAKHKPVKFLFSFPEKGSEEIVEKTKSLLTKLNLYFPITNMSERILIDALDNSCNKANALKKIAKILKVDVKEIHTIGDNNNDLEMVEQSNNGCTLQNGVEPLKKIAKHVLDSIDNNGVGKYLRDLVNNK